MGILDLLRGHFSSADDAENGQTDSVRLIVRELDAVPPERARFVASFGYLLGRIAYADWTISGEERAKMAEILRRVGSLPAETADQIVRLVESRQKLAGRTEDYLVAREFREVSSREERLRLLDCLFAVAAADGVISAEEEAAARQTASELGLSQREFSTALSRYRDQRSVFMNP